MTTFNIISGLFQHTNKKIKDAISNLSRRGTHLNNIMFLSNSVINIKPIRSSVRCVHKVPLTSDMFLCVHSAVVPHRSEEINTTVNKLYV